MTKPLIHIGFAGLGQMGRPIAHNIARGGTKLTVCNIDSAPLAEFAARGFAVTTSPRELNDADVIFLCLPDADVVRSVMLGAHGIAPRFSQIIVDLGTTAYAATLEFAEACLSKGAHFIDAPVSGMEARAKDGTLTVMCGGEHTVFDRVSAYLDLIGNKVLYMGPSGSGQLTKLINQLLFDINAAALAEILPMAVKMGLDPSLVGDVVNSGTGRSYASEFFIDRMLKGHFADGYAMAKAYKDLVSGAEISARKCIPMPVLAAATVTYQMALLKGHGSKDKGGMVAVYEDLLGVEYRAPVAD